MKSTILYFCLVTGFIYKVKNKKVYCFRKSTKHWHRSNLSYADFKYDIKENTGMVPLI